MNEHVYYHSSLYSDGLQVFCTVTKDGNSYTSQVDVRDIQGLKTLEPNNDSIELAKQRALNVCMTLIRR